MNTYLYMEEDPPRVVRSDQATPEEDDVGYPFGASYPAGTVGKLVKVIDEDGLFYVEFDQEVQLMPGERVAVLHNVTLP